MTVTSTSSASCSRQAEPGSRCQRCVGSSVQRLWSFLLRDPPSSSSSRRESPAASAAQPNGVLAIVPRDRTAHGRHKQRRKDDRRMTSTERCIDRRERCCLCCFVLPTMYPGESRGSRGVAGVASVPRSRVQPLWNAPQEPVHVEERCWNATCCVLALWPDHEHASNAWFDPAQLQNPPTFMLQLSLHPHAAISINGWSNCPFTRCMLQQLEGE